MTERRNVLPLRPSGEIKCPMCGHSGVDTRLEEEQLPYGEGADAVELPVVVPVRTCRACAFEFTDDEAEKIRHEAICRHLGVMTPAEVAAIRKNCGSRAEFANLTRIGEASLARWENGLLIQNGAYDEFLYLLTFDDNIKRLKLRKRGSRVAGEASAGSAAAPRFLRLVITPNKRQEKEGFHPQRKKIAGGR